MRGPVMFIVFLSLIAVSLSSKPPFATVSVSKEESVLASEVVAALESGVGLGEKVQKAVERGGRVVRLKPVFLVPTTLSNGLEALSRRGPQCGGLIPRGRFRRVWLERSVRPRSRAGVDHASVCAVTALGLDIGAEGYAANVEGMVYRPTQGVAPLENLCSPPFLTTGYMDTLAKNLRGLGLKDGLNLFAGAYDWRRTPDNQVPFFRQWMRDIAKAVKANRDMPVTVFAHGAGNLYFLYFVRMVEAGKMPRDLYQGMTGSDWLAHHVDMYYAVGAPFLGTAAALRDVVFGSDSLESVGIPRVTLRELHASIESSAYQFPVDVEYEKAYPSGTNDILTVGESRVVGRTFNLGDLGDAFKLIDGARLADDQTSRRHSRFAKMVRRIREKADLNVGVHPPSAVRKMHVRCFWSESEDTPLKLRFPSISTMGSLTMETTPGDGVVPTLSASHCTKWSTAGNVIGRAVGKANHRTLLSNPEVTMHLLKHLLVDVVPPTIKSAGEEGFDPNAERDGGGQRSEAAKGKARTAAKDKSKNKNKDAGEAAAPVVAEGAEPESGLNAVIADAAKYPGTAGDNSREISRARSKAEEASAGMADAEAQAAETRNGNFLKALHAAEVASRGALNSAKKQVANAGSSGSSSSSSSSSSASSSSSSSSSSSPSSSAAASAAGTANDSKLDVTSDNDSSSKIVDPNCDTPQCIIDRSDAKIKALRAKLAQLDKETPNF